MVIDNERTLEIYGYISDELKPQSNMPIVVICDECGRYRDVQKRQYFELCSSCAHKKSYEDDPTIRDRKSIAMKKAHESDPTLRERKSSAMKKLHKDDPTLRERKSVAMKKLHENNPTLRERKSVATKKAYKDDPTIRERQSITHKKRYKDDPTLRDRMSGKNNGNWQGGISFGKYCPKFNESMKQYIRDKYDNCDYISGIPAYICNSSMKLDVHHIDYNKEQGCEDHEWRLIPLSHTNHTRTNFNRDFWNRLFTYSLQYDETYYNDKHINIMEMT